MSQQKQVIYSINDGNLDCDTTKIKVNDGFSARPQFLSKQITINWMICFGFVVMFGLRLGMAYANFKPHNSMYYKEISFFIGFLIGQIVGAYAATKFPAQNVFRVTITVSWLANLVLPSTLYLSWHSINILRGLQGSGEGAMFMACFAMWAYWTPLNRTTLVTMAVCGSYSAVMSEVLFYALPKVQDEGFFDYGFLALLWYSAWLWFAVEKPSKPSESRELRYVDSIVYNKGDEEEHVENLPWKSLLTSAPVWTIFFADFCKACTFYLSMFYTVVFAFQRFFIRMEQSAVYGLLITALALLVFPIRELCSKYLGKTTDRSTAKSRTHFTLTGIGIQATCVLVLCLSTSHPLTFFTLLLGTSLTGIAISGSYTGFADIAGQYAPTLISLSNVVRVAAGIAVPLLINLARYLMGFNCWMVVFISFSLINAMGVILYVAYSSAEVQIWAKKDTFRQNLRTALAREKDGGANQKLEFVL